MHPDNFVLLAAGALAGMALAFSLVLPFHGTGAPSARNSAPVLIGSALCLGGNCGAGR